MNTNSIILVVGVARKETIHIETCLKDLEYEILPLNDEGTGIALPMSKAPGLMLVYAQEDTKNTIAICEQLRKDPKGATTPILMVIGRYKMSQFYELRKRFDNIVSTIHPFNKEEICAKINEMLGIT